MKSSTKTLLKSVIALSVISVVCVALLAVANAFIPKYKPKLDLATVTLINGIVPSGVDEKTALDEGYFEMLDLDDKKLADFNKENRADANNAVLAVYKTVKGENEGVYIVEAQGQGYAGAIIMLTAVNADGTIFGIELKSESENSPGTDGIFVKSHFDAFKEYVKGKTQLSDADINASTGATSMYSIGGVVKAANLSVKAVEAVVGGSL